MSLASRRIGDALARTRASILGRVRVAPLPPGPRAVAAFAATSAVAGPVALFLLALSEQLPSPLAWLIPAVQAALLMAPLAWKGRAPFLRAFATLAGGFYYLIAFIGLDESYLLSTCTFGPVAAVRGFAGQPGRARILHPLAWGFFGVLMGVGAGTTLESAVEGSAWLEDYRGVFVLASCYLGFWIASACGDWFASTAWTQVVPRRGSETATKPATISPVRRVLAALRLRYRSVRDARRWIPALATVLLAAVTALSVDALWASLAGAQGTLLESADTPAAYALLTTLFLFPFLARGTAAFGVALLALLTVVTSAFFVRGDGALAAAPCIAWLVGAMHGRTGWKAAINVLGVALGAATAIAVVLLYFQGVSSHGIVSYLVEPAGAHRLGLGLAAVMMWGCVAYADAVADWLVSRGEERGIDTPAVADGVPQGDIERLRARLLVSPGVMRVISACLLLLGIMLPWAFMKLRSTHHRPTYSPMGQLRPELVVVPGVLAREAAPQPANAGVRLAVSRAEITIGELRRLTGAAVPLPVWNPDLPVIVHVDTAELYCNALSRLEGLEECYPEHDGCSGYRLPTVDEGRHFTSATRGSKGAAPDDDVLRLGWLADNSGGRLHPVGEKPPDAWGLYDIYGNAPEIAVVGGQWAYACGGSVSTPARSLNAGPFACDVNLDKVAGFRVVRSLPGDRSLNGR